MVPMSMPVVFVDSGYYADLKNFLNKAHDQGFISSKVEDLCELQERAIECLNEKLSG